MCEWRKSLDWHIQVFCTACGARSNSRKSSRVPLMVERGKLAVLETPSSDNTVGAGRQIASLLQEASQERRVALGCSFLVIIPDPWGANLEIPLTARPILDSEVVRPSSYHGWGQQDWVEPNQTKIVHWTPWRRMTIPSNGEVRHSAWEACVPWAPDWGVLEFRPGTKGRQDLCWCS